MMRTLAERSLNAAARGRRHGSRRWWSRRANDLCAVAVLVLLPVTTLQPASGSWMTTSQNRNEQTHRQQGGQDRNPASPATHGAMDRGDEEAGQYRASHPAASPSPASPLRFPVEPAELDDTHIRLATEALVHRLYASRNSAGHWERQYPDTAMAHINAHLGGHTALATLALLMAGESHQDPRLKPAVDYLIAREPDHTYVRSLRAHVFALLPDRFGPALDRDRAWLLRTYDNNSGSWNYTHVPIGFGYDNSLTQYGVLGLWEAVKQGQEVPKGMWERVEKHFLRTQLGDGAWNYRPTPGVEQARGSMVAAGLTCLFITEDLLRAAEYMKPGTQPSSARQAIDRGLAWLTANFAADRHPGSPGGVPDAYLFYYLYGIERVGLASGIKRFGDRDWFREGAATIINRLLEPAIDASTGLPDPARLQVRNDLAATSRDEPALVQMSFALMFLARGRVPVAVSKLQSEGTSWNNRPRDVANLVTRLGEAVEAPLSWQILPSDSAVAEWFDSPLVYLAGHEPLDWVPVHEEVVATRQRIRDQRSSGRSTAGGDDAPTRHDDPTTLERLRHYLNLGGLLFTTADAESDGFSTSVYALGRAMYPNLAWRELPTDHWVYRMAEAVGDPPVLYGLSNGVRELMIHAPEGDFGGILQVRELERHPDIAATLANLYYYASERHQPRPRLAHDRLPIEPVPDSAIPRGPAFNSLLPSEGLERGPTGSPYVDPLRGRRLDAPPPGGEVRVILRGVHDGNWNPEPAADRVFAERLLDVRGLRVIFRDVRLDQAADLAAEGVPGRVLWIRGVDASDLPGRAEAWSAVWSFAAAGGVVFVETVGGVGDFGREAERLVLDHWPEARFRRMAREPLLTGEGVPGAVDCRSVQYRLFSIVELGNVERQPRLRGLSLERGPGVPDPADMDGAAPPRGGAGERRDPVVLVSRDDLTHGLLHQPVWGVSGYGGGDALAIVGNMLELAAASGPANGVSR